MGNSLNTAELDAKVAQILDAALKESDLSLRRLAEASGVKLTRLGDVLRRGRAITTGELEAVARALGLVPWKVLKEAEEVASALDVEGAVPDVDTAGAAEPSPRLSVVDGGSSASIQRGHAPSLSEIEKTNGNIA